MPRYFFNTQDGAVDKDAHGVDCDSPTEARLEALKLIGRILLDEPELLKDDTPLRVWVTDESGATRFEVDAIVAISQSDTTAR